MGALGGENRRVDLFWDPLNTVPQPMSSAAQHRMSSCRPAGGHHPVPHLLAAQQIYSLFRDYAYLET